MDKIIIQGLEVKSLIGIYDWERESKQTLLIDLEIMLDLSCAAKSDKVSDTIHYAELAMQIESICEQSEFELLEALADRLIQHVLSLAPLQSVSLAITKPNILPNAKAVTVQLTRTVN